MTSARSVSVRPGDPALERHPEDRHAGLRREVRLDASLPQRLGERRDERCHSDELALLDDLDGLHAAARAADGVVHLAFRHDAMQAGDFTGAAETDLIAFARQHGVSTYVGDGSNRWPAVHTLDAARLYRLALESAPAGTRLHAVGDEGIEFRRIAEAIGQGLDMPVRSVQAEQAAEYVGFLAPFAALDNPTSAARTRELLDWQPTHPGLLDDLAEGHYFRTAN